MPTVDDNAPIRVLVVDDSALARQTLVHHIASEPSLSVIGTAADAFVARQKILRLNPDVITLDIEMPRVDGVVFLRQLMKHHPLPVVVVSANGRRIVEALAAGAVEVLEKPHGTRRLDGLAPQLTEKIRAAASVRRLTPWRTARKLPVVPSTPRLANSRTIIALGASTGGPLALEYVLSRLPTPCPGIVIVQHMPARAIADFAKRLNSVCNIHVKEAQDGDVVAAGTALLAPGDTHMLVVRRELECRVQIRRGPPVRHHCPSIDVLFRSVAECGNGPAIGVIMTGMGGDGADGLAKMRRMGATTFAQGEESCAIFGMPRAAIDRGAVQCIAELDELPALIAQAIQGHAAMAVPRPQMKSTSVNELTVRDVI